MFYGVFELTLCFLENIEDMIFMQDGASPQFATAFGEKLNEHFSTFLGYWLLQPGRVLSHKSRLHFVTFLGRLVKRFSLLYETNNSGRI